MSFSEDRCKIRHLEKKKTDLNKAYTMMNLELAFTTQENDFVGMVGIPLKSLV